MKKLLTLMIAASCVFAADPARWINITTDSKTANKHSKLEIYQGESVQFDIAARNGSKRANLDSTALPVWKAWLAATPNTLAINSTGTMVSASGGQVRVTLTPAAANVATGVYQSAVWLVSGSTYKGTVARGELQVLYSPAGTEPYTAPTGTRLVDLIDVSTNAPQDGQTLAFDADSGDWTNAIAGAGSGDLTAVQVGTNGTLTVASGTGPIPVISLSTNTIRLATSAQATNAYTWAVAASSTNGLVATSQTNVLASTADLAAYAPLAGATFSGAVSVGANRFTAGAELDFTGAGAISPLDMGDSKITSLGVPYNGTDATTKDYVDNLHATLGTVSTNATSIGQYISWNGTVWTNSTASGTGDFLADGSIPMTGTLQLGANNLTSSGNLDGRDVSADGIVLDAVATTYLPLAGGTMLGNINLVGTDITVDVTSDIKASVGTARIFMSNDTADKITFENDEGSVRLVGNPSTVFNLNSQADPDFRIFGSSSTNFFHADVGTERIGMGTYTPSSELEVVGTITATDYTGILTQLGTVATNATADGQTLEWNNSAGVWTNATAAGSGDVTAAAVLGNNLLIRGDGASKGVQNSGITIDDSDNLTGIGTLNGNAIATGTNTGDEPSASDTVAGIVELATIAEVNTGTNALLAVTPDSLEGSALQIKVDALDTDLTTFSLPASMTIATNAAADNQVLLYDLSADVWTNRTAALIDKIGIAISDETTALATGLAKTTFRMPHAFDLDEVRATVTTAATTTNYIEIDINLNNATNTILSTKLSIDRTELTSFTAATNAVISTSALANDDQIIIDIDKVGGGVAGAGLKLWFIDHPDQ